jgi:hypothetical protein
MFRPIPLKPPARFNPPESNHLTKKFVWLFQPMYTLLLYTLLCTWANLQKKGVIFFGITSDAHR